MSDLKILFSIDLDPDKSNLVFNENTIQLFFENTSYKKYAHLCLKSGLIFFSLNYRQCFQMLNINLYILFNSIKIFITPKEIK